MKYCVLIKEGNIVLLENIKTGEKKEENINSFNFEIKENDIVIFENNKYSLDNKEKEDRLSRIREKMNKLRKDD